MRSLSTYLWYWATGHPRCDFVDLGLGIAARERRARRFWAPHLSLSKVFQEQAFNEAPAVEQVVILGAGRLLDVPLAVYLARPATCLKLYDADPSAVASWRGAVRRYPGRIVGCDDDVTGTLERWTDIISGTARDHDSAVAALQALPSPTWTLSAPGAMVVSLNLLSQIPIFWRDRAEKILKTRGIDPEAPAIQAALGASYGVLARHHLLLLERSGAERIIVIADRALLYYRPDVSAWQEEAVLAECASSVPGYELVRRESWFWHVLPWGLERTSAGCIHDVVALDFLRRPESGTEAR